MTIEECYQKMGGSYGEVSARIPSASLISKFIGRFLEDGSFEALCSGMQAGNREEAFRAAHTLKGVCANLSLTRLLDAASRVTEILRPKADAIPEEAFSALEEVRQAYQSTTETIREYLGQ